MNLFYVKKLDGSYEPFDIRKIEKVVSVAAEGLNIDLDKFIEQLKLSIYPNISVSEIQQNLINTALSIIVTDENKEEWSYFANRLLLIQYKKQIKIDRMKKYPDAKVTRYGYFQKFKDYYVFLKEHIDKGIYNPLLLKVPYRVFLKIYNEIFDKDKYTNPLWKKGVFHFQTKKLIDTYIVEENNKPIELIEELWMLQSVLAFLPSVIKYKQYDWDTYIQKVLKHYYYLSNFMIIPSTPQMLNLRRQNGNLSSCFILDVKDNTESLCYTQTQIAQISRNAGGIGLYMGRIRPSGSWIDSNKGLTNNIIDWVKLYDATVEAWNQRGKRKGSITIALPIWHKDIIDFLQVIDVDKGNILKKSPGVFTQVVIPNFFFEYVNKDLDFYLVDNHEITNILGYKELDLIDVYGEELKRRYEKIVQLINEGKITNYKKVKARDLLKEIFYYWNRKGLPYIAFEDNINNYSPYKLKIHSVNLCVENFSPFNNTDPTIEDNKGYIHSCNITNINLPVLYESNILSDINKLEEFINHIYEYMDNLIDLTELPVEESKRHNELFRTVTMGFIGLADLFVKYSVDNNTYIGYRPTYRNKDKNETLKFVDDLFGKIGFLSVLASTRLAKERGRLKWFDKTKYMDNVILGRFHIENDKQLIIEKIGTERYEELKNNLQEYGIRNSLLLNCPPNTSTSLIAGSTPGILPTFNIVFMSDQQKSIYIKFVRYYQYKFMYDVYSRFSTYEDYIDLIDIISTIQKYIDAGISFEITVNHNYFDTPEKLTKLYLLIISNARKKGIKTIYYLRHILKDENLTEDNNKQICESCAN